MNESQAQLDRFAAGVGVRFQVLDNHAEQHGVPAAALGAGAGLAFRARVTLVNRGTPFRGVPWELHLPLQRRILAIEESGFGYRHITGDHHVISPMTPDLDTDQVLSFTLIGEERLRHRIEVLPRWYLASPGLTPRVISATDDDDVTHFVAPIEPSHRTASTQDRFWTYSRQSGQTPPEVLAPRTPDAVATDRTRVVPRPLRTVPGPGMTDLSEGVGVRCLDLSPGRLDAIESLIRQSGLGPGPHRIDVAVSPADLPAEIRRPEGYTLQVSEASSTIIGFDADGARHGVVSLLSLLDTESRVPQVRIEDAPRYRYRGLMLDLARNLPGQDTLLLILDQMTMLKLNRLHLHLSDDEGWRIEIPALPELTTVGAHRGHTAEESETMLPLLGSGPDGTRGSGFLSAEQYRALVSAAGDRGIEVIPEIDVPGHSRAAVVAMEQRYHRLALADPPAAIRHRLLDPDDETNLTTVQFYDRLSLINPALDSTIHFLDVVIGTIADYHRRAGHPLRHWHLGGDEVMNLLLGPLYTDSGAPEPGRGRVDQSVQHQPWQESPAARALVADGTLDDVSQLFDRLLGIVDRLAGKHGISGLIGWQDAFRNEVRADRFGCDVSVQVWQTLDQGAARTQANLADAGFGVIGCTPEFLYLDMAQDLDPDEPGVDWAFPQVDVWRLFNLPPGNISQAAEILLDSHDEPYQLLTPDRPGELRGLQAELWTEFVRDDSLLMHLLFPRLPAAAERAWHRAGWELDPVPGRCYSMGASSHVDVAAVRRDWAGFAEVVGRRVLPRLDRAGVSYRIPPPGAVVVAGRLHLNSRFPGLALQYRVGAGEWIPWCSPVAVRASEPIWIRAGTKDGSRWTPAGLVDTSETANRVENDLHEQ